MWVVHSESIPIRVPSRAERTSVCAQSSGTKQRLDRERERERARERDLCTGCDRVQRRIYSYLFIKGGVRNSIL